MNIQVWPIVAAILGALAIVFAGAYLAERRRYRRLQQSAPAPAPKVLADREMLLLRRQAAAKLQQEVDKYIQEFGAGLRQTAGEQQETIKGLSAQITDRQTAAQEQVLEQWQQNLGALASQLQASWSEQAQQLSQQSEAEIVAYKQKMIDKFDKHLDEVVQSFIQDSLGGRVDLGAQMEFLLQQLESHKADIKKDVLNG